MDTYAKFTYPETAKESASSSSTRGIQPVSDNAGMPAKPDLSPINSKAPDTSFQPAAQPLSANQPAQDASGNPGEPANEDGSQGAQQQAPEKPNFERREGESGAAAGSRSTVPGDFFLRPETDEKVVFPYRPEVDVTPLVCGQEFFGELAKSIAKAKRSIDLVSWGIDTDMVFNRAGGSADYDSQTSILGRPYEILCPFTYLACTSEDGICPNKDKEITNTVSLRLADLLGCKAMRGVKVRVLIWEPVYFANNVIDPCHYWFRSKMGIVPNTQFAFREFKGTYYSDKPSFPKVMLQKQRTIIGPWGETLVLDTYEEEYRKGEARKREELIRKKLTQYPDLYSFLYSHHQKMALIDVDAANGFNPELAEGFIMGLNMKEEYWDDTQHAEISKTRVPLAARGSETLNLGPWQDVGVKLRGPILRDMAANMEQGWSQMKEVIPASFIGNGLAALENHKKVKGITWNKNAFTSVSKGLSSTMPPPPRFWKYNMELWGIGVCAFFTGLVEVIDGTLAGAFDVEDKVKPEGAWSGSPPEAERFKLPPETEESAYRQPAQYMRTFYLDGDPKDLSIQQGMYRAIQPAQNGGLLYFENQYFRDPYLSDHLVKLCGQGGNEVGRPAPHIIVVTNRQTNDDGEAVNSEAVIAAEPTYMVYQQLTEVFGSKNILFCWMRTRNPYPPPYESPRPSNVGESLIDAIVKHYKNGGAADLQQLKQRVLILRNKVYTALKYGPGGGTSAVLFTLKDFSDAWGLKLDRLFGWIIPDFSDLKQMAVNALIDGADTLTELTDLYGMLDSSVRSLEEAAPGVAGKVDEWMPPGGVSGGPLFSPVDESDVVENRRISAEIMGRYLKERERIAAEWQLRQQNYRAQIEQDRTLIQDLTKGIGDLESRKRQAAWPETLTLGWRIRNKRAQIEDLREDIEFKQKMMTYESSKAVPGTIYVHSKVLIVDETAAMIGSNNINERSMWHDSENAVLIRATEKDNFPKELRKRLFGIMLDGDMPREYTAKEIFKSFFSHSIKNFEKYKEKSWLESHILTYEPHKKFGGSSVLS